MQTISDLVFNHSQPQILSTVHKHNNPQEHGICGRSETLLRTLEVEALRRC